MTAIETIIFDIDGTLYEDERVYDRYAQELAGFILTDCRAEYWADWRAAKAGHGPARVGLGYDEARDRLFRFAPGPIHSSLDWQGWRGAVAEDERPPARARAGEAGPPVETEIFDLDRVYIGDWWGLLGVLAAHHGVSRENRADAFLATRTYMSSADFCLKPEPWLSDLLSDLRAEGRQLIAMSNSPAPSVADVLDQLTLRDQFDLVIPAAAKPVGLKRFLLGTGMLNRILSVGDHYVNDIAPALETGSYALYIDQHDTGLGQRHARHWRISSRQSLPEWLRNLDKEVRAQ